MNPLRSLYRRWKHSVASRREGRLFGRLGAMDLSSGLGDSAQLLYALVRTEKPKVAVEIGSARGKSTCYIAAAMKQNGHGVLHAIDPHMVTSWNDVASVDTYPILTGNIARLGLEAQVKVVRAVSQEAAEGWSLPIDLLFIDGDHTYEGVKRDFDLFSPFVAPTGVIVIHDTMWEYNKDSIYYRDDMGVPRFVEELRTAGYPIITLSKDWGVSLLQPVRGGYPLVTNPH